MKAKAVYLRRLLWVVLFAVVAFVPAFPDPPLHSGAFVQHVRPDSAIVARIEPVDRELSVRWSDGGAVGELASNGARRRHAFEIEGLRPGTEYDYEVLDASGSVIDAGGFVTPPPAGQDGDEVTFAIVGDSGKTPWWVQVHNSPLFYMVGRYDLLPAHGRPTALGDVMAEESPDFWLHVGDVVYPWGKSEHWTTGFFRPFADLLRRSPCYAVLGNHDLMDDDGRQLMANLYLPENRATGDERHFSFAWGSVRVIGLDLMEHLTKGSPVLDYLDAELAASTEPWRIVMSHFPIHSCSRQGDRTDLIEHLVPLLERHEVDLVLAGHDHNYQRFGDGEAEGPLFVVTGAGGKSLYDLKPHPLLTKAHKAYHFCFVTVEGRRLVFRAIDVDGELIDRFELDLATSTPSRRGLDPSRPRDRRIQDVLDRFP